MALTAKQQAFLDLYCEAIESGTMTDKEARLHAKNTAGYSEYTTYADIINEDMVTAILAYANQRLVMGIPKAVKKLESVVDDPSQDAAKILLDAVGQWMDRGGIIKKESREVIIKAPTGIVVMPAKIALDSE